METTRDSMAVDPTGLPGGVPKKDVVLYFVLLVALSIPIWGISSLFGNRLPLPIKLPVSVFAILVPATAASILTYRRSGAGGLKQLWRKVFDFRQINARAWVLLALLFTPLIHFLSYLWLRWSGSPLPDPILFPIQLAPLFFVAFFFGAIFEELGWTGYIYEPLEKRWGALGAAVIIGLAWALWHFIGDLQVGNPALWVLVHRLGTIVLRVLMVWIYNNSGRSTFLAIVIHAMVNVSDFLFPNYGSHYDPYSNLVFSTILLAVALVGWGPRTLAKYRLAGAKH